MRQDNAQCSGRFPRHWPTRMGCMDQLAAMKPKKVNAPGHWPFVVGCLRRTTQCNWPAGMQWMLRLLYQRHIYRTIQCNRLVVVGNLLHGRVSVTVSERASGWPYSWVHSSWHRRPPHWRAGTSLWTRKRWRAAPCSKESPRMANSIE